MRWWQEILPLSEDQHQSTLRITYQQQSRDFAPSKFAPSSADAVMLVRERLSRIFYRRRFFDYPLKFNSRTLTGMGLTESFLVGMSYLNARTIRRKPEKSLEDFLINRFGSRLYRTFFKDYTQKVWGVPCTDISAEWGAQRIKGLSTNQGSDPCVGRPVPFVQGHGAEGRRNQPYRTISVSKVWTRTNVGGGRPARHAAWWTSTFAPPDSGP